ncbi:hypothetical protein CL633_02525 [bacterium]|nr:hypothetical protein [bacterium]|tara:strand:+ start:13408 stop:13665 length:258 start_codon:yes stop_codon:yes gene_type:complete
MFDKLKKLKQLKQIRDSVGGEKVEVLDQGVKVIINGQMQIQEIKLNSELSTEDQERILKDLINRAMSQIQMKIASKVSGMTGFGM